MSESKIITCDSDGSFNVNINKIFIRPNATEESIKALPECLKYFLNNKNGKCSSDKNYDDQLDPKLNLVNNCLDYCYFGNCTYPPINNPSSTDIFIETGNNDNNSPKKSKNNLLFIIIGVILILAAIFGYYYLYGHKGVKMNKK
jgi:hypothetical protein